MVISTAINRGCCACAASSPARTRAPIRFERCRWHRSHITCCRQLYQRTSRLPGHPHFTMTPARAHEVSRSTYGRLSLCARLAAYRRCCRVREGSAARASQRSLRGSISRAHVGSSTGDTCCDSGQGNGEWPLSGLSCRVSSSAVATSGCAPRPAASHRGSATYGPGPADHARGSGRKFGYSREDLPWVPPYPGKPDGSNSAGVSDRPARSFIPRGRRGSELRVRASEPWRLTSLVVD